MTTFIYRGDRRSAIDEGYDCGNSLRKNGAEPHLMEWWLPIEVPKNIERGEYEPYWIAGFRAGYQGLSKPTIDAVE